MRKGSLLFPITRPQGRGRSPRGDRPSVSRSTGSKQNTLLWPALLGFSGSRAEQAPLDQFLQQGDHGSSATGQLVPGQGRFQGGTQGIGNLRQEQRSQEQESEGKGVGPLDQGPLPSHRKRLSQERKTSPGSLETFLGQGFAARHQLAQQQRRQIRRSLQGLPERPRPEEKTCGRVILLLQGPVPGRR